MTLITYEVWSGLVYALLTLRAAEAPDFSSGSSTRLRLSPGLRGRLANGEPRRRKAPASVSISLMIDLVL